LRRPFAPALLRLPSGNRLRGEMDPASVHAVVESGVVHRLRQKGGAPPTRTRVVNVNPGNFSAETPDPPGLDTGNTGAYNRPIPSVTLETVQEEGKK